MEGNTIEETALVRTLVNRMCYQCDGTRAKCIYTFLQFAKRESPLSPKASNIIFTHFRYSTRRERLRLFFCAHAPHPPPCTSNGHIWLNPTHILRQCTIYSPPHSIVSATGPTTRFRHTIIEQTNTFYQLH